MKCSIVGCDTNVLPRPSLHSLNSGSKFDKNWIEAKLSLNGSGPTLTKRFPVCEKHSNKNCLINIGAGRSQLSSQVIPSIFSNMLKDKTEVLDSDPLHLEHDANISIKNETIDTDHSYAGFTIQEANISSEVVKIESENEEEDLQSDGVTNDELSTPIRKTRQKFDIDKASPEEVKRKCLHYMELCRKKDNQIKVIRRDLKRKVAKIKILEAKVKELQYLEYKRKNGET
ncbi:uncharacterized protein LOC129912893 [Episyrphus balteatus]|uniref:uncharacterized protein LOC129912893 n=1 Tax=Episyrphus balteatus TaxID=286459 RepID=UPI002486C5FB|nr:uncharacterized protein LOC129912893 [Episyrphus balteatus]